MQSTAKEAQPPNRSWADRMVEEDPLTDTLPNPRTVVLSIPRSDVSTACSDHFEEDEGEEEKENTPTGTKLFPVGEKTEEFLTTCFAGKAVDSLRRQWKHRHGAPRTTVTICPHLDKILKGNLSSPRTNNWPRPRHSSWTLQAPSLSSLRNYPRAHCRRTQPERPHRQPSTCSAMPLATSPRRGERGTVVSESTSE